MQPAPWITGHVISEGRKLAGASLVHLPAGDLPDDVPPDVPADVPPGTAPPVPALAVSRGRQRFYGHRVEAAFHVAANQGAVWLAAVHGASERGCNPSAYVVMGRKFTIKYEATVTGDSLQGKAEFNNNVQQPWEAKRSRD